jgi:hypothetical protein
MPDEFDALMAEAQELGKATLHDHLPGPLDLYGSAAFFASATETLLESTRQERELGGACYFVRSGDALVLVGLKRCSNGKATHVAVHPTWGSVLWHTHPGLSFSIAAFSDEDLVGARETDRPLLVIGYRSASPDVLGLTVAAGLLRGRDDEVTERLLRLGVAVQVCWPSGEVHPVRRYRQQGIRKALDEASFHVDRVLGAAARTMQPAAVKTLGGKLRRALSQATRRKK